MWANSEGPGETARMRRFAWAFAGRLYVMGWLIYMNVIETYNDLNSLTWKVLCTEATEQISTAIINI